MKKFNLGLPLIAALLWGGTATAFDEIMVAKRPVQKGTIVAMSPVEVTIDVNRRKIPCPVNEIVGINYDLEPLELKTARRFADGGQFDMAIEKLEGIDETAISRDLILQDIVFYKAYAAAKIALGGGGDPNEAISKMMVFYQKYNSNWHYFRAVETLGDLAVGIRRYDTAAKFYSEVAQAPWPSYKLRAKVLEGRALQSQNKYEEALANFNAVLGVTATIEGAEEQKLFAILGKAACLAATGKHAEGIQIVEDVIARGDPSDIALFANAYNTLGRCYQASNQPKDALLAYLHTDILFYGDPESHAEALSNLIKLWEQVDRPERALQCRNTLKQRYPGSPWNKE
jgi:tetratricopeptide (TPR) repeat protein